MAYDTVRFDKTEMMQWGRNVLSLCEIPNTDDTVATPQSPWRHANVNTRFRVSTESQIGVACASIDSYQGGKGPPFCSGCSFTSEIWFLNFPALPVQYEQTHSFYIKTTAAMQILMKMRKRYMYGTLLIDDWINVTVLQVIGWANTIGYCWSTIERLDP